MRSAQPWNDGGAVDGRPIRRTSSYDWHGPLTHDLIERVTNRRSWAARAAAR